MSGGYRIETFEHRPHIIPDATETSDGVMSSEDKLKLDNIVAAGGGVVVWTFGTPWATVQPFIDGKEVIVLLDPDASSGVVNFVLGPTSADLARARFLSQFDVATTLVLVTVDPAFRLLGAPALNLDNILMQASAPMFTGGGAGLSLSLRNSQLSRAAGTVGPLFDVSSASLRFTQGFLTNGDATDDVIRVRPGGAGCGITLFDASNLAAQSIDGTAPGVATVLNTDSSSVVDPAALGPNLVVTANLLDKALKISYTPTAGLFVGPNPTDVETALNRIAAEVVALSGGPIP